MATIPCVDFFEDTIGTIPVRIKRTNPDAIKDRFFQVVYNMDLSPLPGDEDLGNQQGAWTVWDLPASSAAQIEDDRGNDFITVSILRRIYVLDWDRYRDEWLPNTYAPIYRMMRFGPIPYNKGDTEGRNAYNLAMLKRFREIQFALKQQTPEAGANSVWRISVGQSDNEGSTFRIGVRQTRQLMRALIALKGMSFTVRLENSSNEPFTLLYWRAAWDVLSRRTPESKRSV
jgi:hypothetical protein